MIVSHKCPRVTFGVANLVFFVATIVVSVYIYSAVGTAKWQLFSTISLRSILLIFCTISPMIYALGLVGTMKYSSSWQIVFTSLLIIPVILASILVYFCFSIPHSTESMFTIVDTHSDFVEEKETIVAELGCANCNSTSFSPCAQCAIQKHSSLISLSKAGSVSMLVCSIANFAINLVFIFAFSVDMSDFNSTQE